MTRLYVLKAVSDVVKKGIRPLSASETTRQRTTPQGHPGHTGSDTQRGWTSQVLPRASTRVQTKAGCLVRNVIAPLLSRITSDAPPSTPRASHRQGKPPKADERAFFRPMPRGDVMRSRDPLLPCHPLTLRGWRVVDRDAGHSIPREPLVLSGPLGLETGSGVSIQPRRLRRLANIPRPSSPVPTQRTPRPRHSTSSHSRTKLPHPRQPEPKNAVGTDVRPQHHKAPDSYMYPTSEREPK